MQTGAAYIRVSTEDQIEFSPDSQIKEIRKYAEHNDILLPEEFIFVDEGISGRTAGKRPEFMKMIGLAKTKPKPFDVILLWRFSRFARNRQDSILYKSMLRKDCGIDVVSITEHLSDDPTSILIEALLEAMDEYYSINLAQEVKRGMEERFSRGMAVTGPAFGYKMGDDEYVIDEEKAPIVRMIYEDFINGMPYKQVANKLNAMGVRSNRGNLFENRTIEYILSNPVYIGKIRWNSGELHKRDRFYQGDDVVVTDANHEPIISKETFEAAQKRIRQIKGSYKKYSRQTYATFMLKGLVRCSDCGSTLVLTAKGNGIQCHRYARGQCDVSHYISLNKINEAVLSQIEKDLGNDILEIKTSEVKDTQTSDVTQTLLNRERKKLQRVRDAYESGIDSLEEYKINKENIMARIKELEKKTSHSPRSPDQTRRVFKKQMKSAIPKLRSPDISGAAKNELLKSFISDIIFDRVNNTIQICYYFNE